MPLLAYNKTTSPLPLAFGAVTLPASGSPGVRALPGVNVGGRIQTGAGSDFVALQAQQDAGSVDFVWTAEPEFPTPGLTVGGPPPGNHAATHLAGGTDPLLTFTNVNAVLATATAAIAVNNQKLSLLLTPTVASDAATKGYVDSVSTGAGIPTPIKTAPYTAVFGDIVRVNPNAGGFAITLPVVAGGNTGSTILIKNVSNSINAVTVTPAGGNTIEGLATLVMNQAREAVEFISDGVSDWLAS